MTKTADNPATESAKKSLEAERKISDRSRAEFAQKTKGKPTPTQEELDITASGGHILEHEADGSDPETPQHAEPHNKSMEAERHGSKGSTYPTRQTRAGES
jgi:hypothetical protein